MTEQDNIVKIDFSPQEIELAAEVFSCALARIIYETGQVEMDVRNTEKARQKEKEISDLRLRFMKGSG